ncbi:zinc finger protein 64-like [Physella acuta]|uniref:zinc finger protein 64-like n=1 Tax=Physella acuta TaxID=109671 RepID=UPI0027DC5D11|nr:zinc finger protein 64-like [Physella acuta]
MAQAQLKYRIEIQKAQGIDSVKDEVTVVLDLDGQEKPHKVAKSFMKLAQSGTQDPASVVKVRGKRVPRRGKRESKGEETATPSRKRSAPSVKCEVKQEVPPSKRQCARRGRPARGSTLKNKKSVKEKKKGGKKAKDNSFTVEDEPRDKDGMVSESCQTDRELAQKRALAYAVSQNLVYAVNQEEADKILGMSVLSVDIEPVKLEDVEIFQSSRPRFYTEEPPGKPLVLDATDLERVSVMDNSTNEMKTRFLVHNLAELERAKIEQDTSSELKRKERPPTIGASVTTVAQGKTSDKPEQNLVVVLDNQALCKTEPPWLDEAGAEQPSVPQEVAEQPSVPHETAEQPETPQEAADVTEEKKCTQCEFTCHGDLELGRHLKNVHKEKAPFKCSVCNSAFQVETSLQVHALCHAEIKPPPVKWRKKKKKMLPCPVCSLSFTTIKKVTAHVVNAHDLPVFHCSSCRFVCLNMDELQAHNSTIQHMKASSKVAICPVCQVVTLKLTSHLIKQHPEYRPYVCDECGFQSKSSSGLKYHKETHIEGKRFKCPQCGHACKSKIVLKRHIRNHNPERKFKCTQCSFSTNESYEFKRHVERVHIKRSFYSCKFCDLSFVQMCDLKLHSMSEHRTSDGYFCTYCDFSCQRRAELKTHIQSHTGSHRYLCEYCDFTTPFRAHLDRHRNRHTDDRPFKCTVCSFQCRESMNLKKHMVVHSDEKPFSCSLCPYTCKLKGMLDSHVRIVHSSIKPYACNVCPYRAKTSGNLKKHMWIHSEYKPHKCPFCGYTAREKNKLGRHVQTKHKEQAEKQQQVKQSGEPPV